MADYSKILTNLGGLLGGATPFEPWGSLAGRALGGLASNAINNYKAPQATVAPQQSLARPSMSVGRYSKGNAWNIPAPPVYQTAPEMAATLSWDDAMERAKARYEPEYQSSVLAQNKMAQDQQDYLKQALAGKGYANPRGGQFQVGSGNITQAQAAANDKLRYNYDAMEAALAGQLVTGERNSALAKYQAEVNATNNANLLGFNTWQTKVNTALSQQQSEDNKLNSYVNYFLKWFFPDEYASLGGA